MNNLYRRLVVGNQKAIVAFIVTAVVAFLAKQGVQLPNDAATVLQALLWGVLGLVTVYLKKNK